MKKYIRNTALSLALMLCAWALCVGYAHASTDHWFGPFILRERKIGETFVEPDSKTKAASADFTPAEMKAVSGGMNYWVERIASNKKEAKIIINFAKLTTPPDGTAYSWTPDTGRDNPDTYIYVVGNTYSPLNPDYGYHTEIIFVAKYNPHPTRLLMDDNSITSTMTHEMMHALGMGGVSNRIDAEPWKIVNGNSAWASGLYDIYGTQAKIGMTVVNSSGNNATDTANNTFYLPKVDDSPLGSAATAQFPVFHGTAVDALTGGKGMPVMAGKDNRNKDDTREVLSYEIDGGNVLGHPALLGSIMSYSPLRNMLFTELELAVLKDMGYAIDLKKSFGKSYYPTHLGGKLTSDPGFTGVYAGKGGYLAETPLTVTNNNGFNSDYSYGVGLHVYRDLLTVTQNANINASGYGAGGIRVDGVGNTVTLPSNVTVAANGEVGTGVLVSYGKNNVLNIAGTVQATGAGGIGLHFGITGDPNSSTGHSYYYDDLTSVGSNSDDIYFYTKRNSDLNGPLAKSVNISGSVTGSQAAIQIDRDAHVKDINILNGAKLIGNIIVRWDMWNLAPTATTVADRMTAYGTNLNFGVTGDRTFNLYYTGTIDGRGLMFDSSYTTSALAINFKGGTTSINGDVYAYSATIDKGATLKGSSTYNLNDGTGAGTFLNNGRFSPGNSIGTVTINGNYEHNGRLRMEFDGQGGHDVLVVTGTYTNASGTGREALAPAKGYFPSGTINIDLSKMFLIGSSPAPTFDRLLNTSPTLNFTSSNLGASDVVTIQTARQADAYSRFATSGNAAQAGRALSGIAEVAQGDMQNLFAALDFSALDGSDIRTALPQLTAAPYAQTAQASAEGNLNMGRMSLAYLRTAGAPMTAGRGQAGTTGLAGGSDTAPQWSAFVMPFGGASQQQSHKGTAGYNSSDVGIMGGVYRQTDHVTLSLYTALSRRQVDMWTTAGAQARSNALHVGTAALWQEKTDQGWQLWGLAQLGMENTDMRRSVAFAGFARENMSSWTSLNGVTTAGAGYLWQVGALSFGPQIGLEYAFNAVPAVEERNGGATRLGMEAHVRHDLRGVAGLMTAWNVDIGQGRGLRASLEAVWRQDMLAPQRNVRTHFVGYSQFPFDSRVERAGQGSLGLTGGVQVNLRKDVILSVQVEADVLRHSYSSVGGGLSLRWEF